VIALSPLNRKLLRDMWRIRTQVIAIAVVIACGVATVVMALGVYNSLELTRTVYYERQAFAQVFADLTRAPLSVARDIANISGVSAVDDRVVGRAVVEIAGARRPAVGQLVSLPTPNQLGLNRVFLRWGRMPQSGSLDEVVVSEAFAEAHNLQPNDEVSAVLNGRKRSLRVVGVGLSPEFVYAVGPGQIIPDDATFGVFWLDRTGLEASFDLVKAFNNISLTLMRGTNQQAVIAEVDRILAPYGGLGAYGRIEHVSHAFLDSELNQLRVMARILPPIFLAVAAFLLHIVLTRLVSTEREQIGLLKAFGYGDLSIGAHYLKMAVIISAIGAIAGIGLGGWMGRGITILYSDFLFHFPFLQYQTDSTVLLAASGASFVTALLGVITAVLGILKLTPAVAMQPRAPAVYRAGFFERTGLLRGLHPSLRMAWRHIGRSTLRSTMTTTGIGASIGLIIFSLFSLDAIEEMIDVFYFRVQHQDVTVVFELPQSAHAIHEVARLPGVMRAEPIRAVPVKLISGPIEDRVAIMSRPADSRLSSLLDLNLAPMAIPPHGLVLSVTLANKLGVAPGDDLRVEVLSGERRKTDIRVAALTEEFVGLSAYMSEGALQALTRDETGISGARLAVDPAQLDTLYAAATEIPAIASITGRDIAINSFRDTMAETMNISLFFYVGFATAITFGVIYNAARIALSERARELATLRVLGFYDSETAGVLLGEFAILSICALPVGWAVGWGLAAFMVSSFATEMFRIPFVIYLPTYAIASLLGLAAAIISGYFVARRITRFDLISVLKTRD
jgi:putative ABC transport system permease protein